MAVLQEAEGTAGQGTGTGAVPAHLGSGSCQPGTAGTLPALEHSICHSVIVSNVFNKLFALLKQWGNPVL